MVSSATIDFAIRLSFIALLGYWSFRVIAPFLTIGLWTHPMRLLFTAYMIPVGLIENVLRSVLMARGLTTPKPVIIIGVIGGTIARAPRQSV